VIQISKTKRGEKNQSGELCFATWKGLFFGGYDKSYSISFAENKEESYFNERNVRSFFEYELDKFVCAICKDKNYIQLIDRSNKQITTKVKNPANDSWVV